jgi:hypothetical protein
MLISLKYNILNKEKPPYPGNDRVALFLRELYVHIVYGKQTSQRRL